MCSYLKQTKMSFFKNGEQEGKTGPVWGWYQWRAEGVGKGCRGRIWWKYVLKYDNGRMSPIKTIPGMGGGEKKENDGVNEFSYDIL
jgi:hypothetical protein